MGWTVPGLVASALILERCRSIVGSSCNLVCQEAHIPTDPAIDRDLLEPALAASGGRTKKAVITRALQKFIGRREQARIPGFFGTVEIDPEYDCKAERSRG